MGFSTERCAQSLKILRLRFTDAVKPVPKHMRMDVEEVPSGKKIPLSEICSPALLHKATNIGISVFGGSEIQWINSPLGG